MHAHFHGHAYDAHDHDELLVGVTQQGVQRFRCHRASHTSTPGRPILIEPVAVHDGHAPDAAGFTDAMLYLPQRWVAQHLEHSEQGGLSRLLPAFRSTLSGDAELGAAIQRAFDCLHGQEGRLVRDQSLDRLLAPCGAAGAPHGAGVGSACRFMQAFAVLDALALADKFSIRMMGGTPRFEVSLAGVRRRVRSGLGLALPVQPVTPGMKTDWAIVPALNTGTPEVLVPALARPDVKSAIAQVVAWRAGGTRIAASCIGTFLLAEAGLLDGREATTTWWLSPLFRQRYPGAKLDESRMLVPTDIGVTAGAALGHLDLALWLVRLASPVLAGVVSRYLRADLR